MRYYYINPLSDDQRNKLFKQLPKLLEKFDRPDDFEYFSGLIDVIADLDPTASGIYSSWVLKQLIMNQLHLPEDEQKIFETLQHFMRISPRIPKKYRNIFRYKTYSELFKVVEEFLPKTWSKRELQKMGTKQIASNGPFSVFELSTPEAVVAVSKNTGWCTCNYKTAKEYLSKALLYIIYKGQEKYLLVHPDSKEVMHTDNSPYEKNEPELIEIFKIHFPSVFCSIHNSFKNKQCYSCEKFGCCNYIQCGHAGCPVWICPSGECGKRCKTCEVYHCDDDIVEECEQCGPGEGHICKSCAAEEEGTCSDCGNVMCADHKILCGFCDYYSCQECISKCWECNQNYCTSTDCSFECSYCGKELCRYCATKPEGKHPNKSLCSVCNYEFCDECIYECNICGELACHGNINDDGECNTCKPEVEEDDFEDDEDDESDLMSFFEDDED